jgi:hypothetical protein
VYQSGDARVTKRLPSGQTGWDDSYQITEDIARIIHPDLKWIISMPLKSQQKQIIGVLNVDCLKEDVEMNHLLSCMGQMTMQAFLLGRMPDVE